MPLPMRYFYSALVIMVLAGCGAWVAAWPGTQFDVTAVPATTGPVVRRIAQQSVLHAVQTVDVVATVSGEVQALEAEPNTAVQAGDILARIDATPFEDALREARTTLAYLKVEESASPQRIADAEATVRAATRDLDRTIVRAPVDGVVVVRNVSVGQIVTTGDGAPILYRIATDLRHLEVAVDVAPTDLARLRPGSDVVVAVTDADETEWHGQISRVGLTTIIEVPNPDLRLQPGTTVTAIVVLDRRDDVLRVPSDALAFTPPEGSTAIVDRGAGSLSTASAPSGGRMQEVWRYQHGRLTPVAVRIGLSGEGWTEIDSGLQEGDEVATGVVARRVSIWSAILSL
jgi:HlyD family secretion protein